MKTISDSAGAKWDVLVSKESYGALFLLFCPGSNGSKTEHGCRRYSLRDETLLAAEQSLTKMSESALQKALAQAEPWHPA